MNYRIITLADRFDLFDVQDAICEEVWPEFMLHDPVAGKYWGRFINAFKEYQLMLMDGDEILAVVNSVPLHIEGNLDNLPDEGWDWGVRKSVEDFDSGIQANILMGVQIVINKRHQGKGLSSLAVSEMSALAGRQGFDQLIVPVRPSGKHNYPLIPMDDYLLWENGQGLPRDNWLRVHIKAGGKILKTCPEAMRIPGTVDQWKSWTNLDFPGNGSYIVRGALNPISIDIENDLGLYIEPNVWIVHEIQNNG